MTKSEVITYLESCAQFRRDRAQASRPGSQAVIKNEQYAFNLERVIKYIQELPADDSTLERLQPVSYETLAYGNDQGLHTQTIHCSLGKPPKYGEWFSTWTDCVVSSLGDEGGAE